MPEFRKWKSINKFSDAYAKAQKFGVKEFCYCGKIKLHGTNAGIHLEDGVLYPQKRSSFITVDNDNCGFAEFVSNLEYNCVTVFSRGIILYGEWAGPGVQKGDAVTQIENKTFFIFSIYDVSADYWYFSPSAIEFVVRDIFGDNYQDKRIRVLPWATEPITLDFSRQGDCQQFIDSVMKQVDEVIAKEDPYIKEAFGVRGTGEGLVMYGIRGKSFDGSDLENSVVFDYIFKAKTEAHSVQKSKNRNHVAPERPEGVDDFIEMFYTEQRFEQMLNQIGGEATREKTGQFMKAVMSDVYKESEQEILLANFEWKDVPRYATPIVKAWWFKKCDEL